MKFFIPIGLLIAFVFIQGCSASRHGKTIQENETVNRPAEKNVIPNKNSESGKTVPARIINTRDVDPDSVVNFAETLRGVKYNYGSAIKEKGFDCSGFVTYVFNHYNISVPRVSKDFTNAGATVTLDNSKRGDLILFTGTDTTGWVVGHMGFITHNDNGKIAFIHSSSGKSIGVIISDLSKYYATRFVKVIRVFNE